MIEGSGRCVIVPPAVWFTVVTRSVDHAIAHQLVHLPLRVTEELRQDLSCVDADEIGCGPAGAIAAPST
jgi:hypothetical protein